VPRYDLPNHAPEPLRLVQRLVNTVDFERNRDWLADLLAEEGVQASAAGLDQARHVREAVRELLYANNGQTTEGDPYDVLRHAADSASFTLDLEVPALAPSATGVDGLLGRVLAVAYGAMVDGSWSRLKACRNHGCRWAFYDFSRNRSASWCSMQLCGNRTKTRAYRRRHGTTA
jgi:predicted RNA-binding Zn ribbon-like protein